MTLRPGDRRARATLRIRRRALAGAALACGLLAMLVGAGVLVGLRATTGLLLAIPIRNVDHLGFHERLLDEADRPRFRAELQPVIRSLPTTEAKVLAILDWTMDQVGRVENYQARSAWGMVQAARGGRGLICGGMSAIFHDALISNGIPARIVLFRRDIFDPYDSHATVEAFVDGKWRLYDPTFHIELTQGRGAMNAWEARAAVVLQKGEAFRIRSLGPTRYPSPVERYYVKYTSLLDNVFVQQPLYVLGLRLPLAYFCLDCEVSERSSLVYSVMILSLAALTAAGGALASAGVIGLLRTGRSATA